MTVGIVHPGELGAEIGQLLARAGRTVLWASSGRSQATSRRARAAGLVDAGTIEHLADRSAVVISICPPHAALAVAREVEGFGGLFVDANAVSPQSVAAIEAVVVAGGAGFVDAGVIGTPRSAGSMRIYLSGAHAAEVAALFAESGLDARIVSERIGDASALKMTYAAWTKGSTALLLAARAAARAGGVESALLGEWAMSQPELADRLQIGALGAAVKAWRWIGEMEEVAATFMDAGLPDGFHRAAADVYRSLSKADRDPAESGDSDEAVLDAVIDSLLGRG